MDAIDLLKTDHDVVEMLFSRIESTPPSRHEATFKKIKNELDAHVHVEEKILYPACEKKGDKELRDMTAESWEEHSQMKKFLKEIARSTSTEKREAKLKVLMEDTRNHVKDEEDEMFPMIRDQFGAQELEAMADRMQAEKLKFQKAKGIPPRRELPKGIVETVIDKAKEVVASITGGGASDGKTRTSKSRKSTTTASPRSGSRAGSASTSKKNGSGSPKGAKARPTAKTSSAKGTKPSKASSAAKSRSSSKGAGFTT